jgi:polysaccharide deacetylase family protein (PEP-CTERM system associated)
MIANALTFDVEDWHQLVAGRLTGIVPPCSVHLEPQMEHVLGVLAEHGVKATFFILAHVASAFPGLVRQIHESGHEVASHGWSHALVYRQSRDQFSRETHDAKALLENTIGAPVKGYRAAEFSITDRSRWALDVLAEAGFTYDSSIFPIQGSRYGIRGAPLQPHLIRTESGATITEVPLTAVRWLGRRWPVGGGGYFRLLPYAVTRAAISRINRDSRAAVVYFHPYEFSERPLVLDGTNWWQTITAGRFTLFHNFNRAANRRRFARLLRDFRFWPVMNLLQHGPANQTVF